MKQFQQCQEAVQIVSVYGVGKIQGQPTIAITRLQLEMTVKMACLSIN